MMMPLADLLVQVYVLVDDAYRQLYGSASAPAPTHSSHHIALVDEGSDQVKIFAAEILDRLEAVTTRAIRAEAECDQLRRQLACQDGPGTTNGSAATDGSSAWIRRVFGR